MAPGNPRRHLTHSQEVQHDTLERGQHSMAKKLATTVYVDGVAYGPNDDVPADVAEQITNEKAWADESDEGEPGYAPTPEDLEDADEDDESDDESDDEDTEQPPAADYGGWVKKDLLAEIDKRNDGRADDAKIVPASDNNGDLVAALKADDLSADA